MKLSEKAAQLENLQTGMYLMNRKKQACKVLAVLAPELYVVSKNNGFDSSAGIYTANDLIRFDADLEVVSEEKALKLLENGKDGDFLY